MAERPPIGITTLAPLSVAPSQPQSNRWNPDRSVWELVPDYGQTPIWDKATGSVLPLPPPPTHQTVTERSPGRAGSTKKTLQMILNA